MTINLLEHLPIKIRERTQLARPEPSQGMARTDTTCSSARIDALGATGRSLEARD